ncbi:hypothetical protein, partial [Streptomyces sp. RP5T]|uniref:hypothetical protein n=1 Tax=Streptomyces sp. RP5T TaxID=2490848 RepID=UPI001C8CB9AA
GGPYDDPAQVDRSTDRHGLPDAERDRPATATASGAIATSSHHLHRPRHGPEAYMAETCSAG